VLCVREMTRRVPHNQIRGFWACLVLKVLAFYCLKKGFYATSRSAKELNSKKRGDESVVLFPFSSRNMECTLLLR
jgi:hypothetical protein